MERHNHCLCLRVIILQQPLLDDQVAVLAFGRQPLADFDETPVQVRRLLLAEDVQGAEMTVPVLSVAHGGVSLSR